MGTDLNPRGVKITIGGEEYEILFTINAIDAIQTETSLPIFDVMEKILHSAYGNLDPENLRTFRTVLTILLQETDPEMTEEKVGKAVIITEYGEIAGAMLKAFGVSVPEPDEDDDDDDEEDETEKDPTPAEQ